MAHTHKCTDCGTPVDCEGTLERNHDGFPAVICTAIHRPGGWTDPVRCEGCEAARELMAAHEDNDRFIELLARQVQQ